MNDEMRGESRARPLPVRQPSGGAVRAVYSWLDRGLDVVATGALWILMVGTVASVIARYVMKVSFTGFFEISSAYLFVGMVLLLLGKLQATDSHIRITLIVDRLPARVRLALSLFGNIVGLCVCAIIVWHASILFIESVVTRALVPALISLPLWIARLLVVIGYAWWALHFLADILRTAETLRLPLAQGARTESDALDRGAL